MAIEQLPPFEPTADRQEPTHDYRVDLSGVTYRLVLQWFERLGSWYISLFDSANVLLISQKRMSIDFPLFFRHTGRRPRGGYLFLLDIEGTKVECNYEDLGNRCKLVWMTTDEIPPYVPPYEVDFEKVS